MKQLTKKRRYLKVSDVLDAMEKDGYKKATGTFFRNRKRANIDWDARSNVVYACAIGQAALNLNIDPNTLQLALGPKLGPEIVSLNDESSRTVRSIARLLKKQWDQDIQERSLGIMIDAPEQEAVSL